MSWRNGKGSSKSGKFWLKLSFQRDAVFEDDKVEGVSNRIRMKGITGVKGDRDVKRLAVQWVSSEDAEIA